jgi:hypothetical protein
MIGSLWVTYLERINMRSTDDTNIELLASFLADTCDVEVGHADSVVSTWITSLRFLFDRLRRDPNAAPISLPAVDSSTMGVEPLFPDPASVRIAVTDPSPVRRLLAYAHAATDPKIAGGCLSDLELALQKETSDVLRAACRHAIGVATSN